MIKLHNNGKYDTEIVYSKEGISPCLRANKGGSSNGSVLIEEETKEDIKYNRKDGVKSIVRSIICSENISRWRRKQ